MSATVREAHLEAASRALDGFLRSTLLDSQLPLATVAADVELWVAQMAAHTLLQAHGFDQPAEGNSDAARAKELEARAMKIAAGVAHLSVANAPTTSTSPFVRSRTKRGWTDDDE